MYLPACIVGLLFVSAFGTTEGRYGSRGKNIIEKETEICERLKKSVRVDGCIECICRSQGYGTVCKLSRCNYSRGRLIDCVRKPPRSMENVLDDFDDPETLSSEFGQ